MDLEVPDDFFDLLDLWEYLEDTLLLEELEPYQLPSVIFLILRAKEFGTKFSILIVALHLGQSLCWLT